MKNVYAANFPPTNFCSSWLLINSHELKREVARNSLLILHPAFVGL